MTERERYVDEGEIKSKIKVGRREQDMKFDILTVINCTNTDDNLLLKFYRCCMQFKFGPFTVLSFAQSHCAAW